MRTLYRRGVLLAVSGSAFVSLAGCNDSLDDEDGQEPTPTGSDGPTPEEPGEEATEEPDTDEGDVYDERSETGEIVLNTFQLPDDFTHLEEEVVVVSDLPADDPERDQLEEDGVLRRHTNQFVQDADPEDAAFVSSTMFVCESVDAAEQLKQSRIEAFAADGGEYTSPDREHEIPTTVVENETGDGDPLRTYLGRHRNAVLELLVTGGMQRPEIEDLYIQMVTSTES